MKKAIGRSISLMLAIIMVAIPAMYAIGFSVIGAEADGAALDLPAMEAKNGSFRIEAENMFMTAPYRIQNGGESENGGKYVDSAPNSLPRVDDPTTIPAPQLRAKFLVEKAAKYKLSIRAWSEDGNADSLWWTADNGTYIRGNHSAKPAWGWMGSVGDVVLAPGWHTLDIKYRETGMKMDTIYLIPADISHTQKWFGSFPGEVPEATPEERAIKKVELNGKRLDFDVLSVVKDGVMYSSFEGMASYLGTDVVITDKGEFSAARYSKTVSGSMDSNVLTVNGTKVEMPSKPFIERNRIFISAKEFFEGFGATTVWDVKNNLFEAKLDIEQDPVWPEADDSAVTVKPYYREASYKIPYANADAKVEIFVRNLKGLYWSKGFAPIYKDGAFVGSVANLGDNSDFILRVRITENGTEKNMIKNFKTMEGKGMTLQDVAYNPEGLLLVPTFENISFYINAPVEGTRCWAQYREVGQKEWKDVYAPYYDTELKQFRGSIVGLKENTQYEVTTKIIKKEDVLRNETAVIKTWDSVVPIAKEIDIKDLYTPGKPIFIYNLVGAPDGWIKIKGDGKTVVEVPDDYTEAMLIAECQYLVFENLIIKGAKNHGMNVGAGSSDIRIQNCEITGWGRTGNFDPSDGCYKTPNNTRINNDAGIRLNDVVNTVVERCYIHDPKGRSNSWSGPTWVSIHPAGPNAIYMRGKVGNVIRYNDLIGSDEHRWNDAIESYNNSERYGGIGKDSDVYGNMFMFGQDDSTELDGGQINSRWFKNKSEGFLCGVSTAATVVGPSYLFRNVIVNLGDEMGSVGSAFKTGWGPSPISIGVNYYFHNTAIGQTGINETSGLHTPFSKNNILETGSKTGLAGASIMSESPLVNFDYDLVYGVVKNKNNPEINGVFGKASFINKEAADFRLATNSLGINKGQWLANFSETVGASIGRAPDMGATEYGEDTLFPTRPIDIRADKYQINLKAFYNTDTITFKIGAVAEGTKYAIRKNDAFDWLDIAGVDGSQLTGELKPNSTLTFKVTGTPQKVDYSRGNGAFTLRLDSGLSIPISVYLQK